MYFENGAMEINTKEQLNKYMESIPEIERSLNHINDNIIKEINLIYIWVNIIQICI